MKTSTKKPILLALLLIITLLLTSLSGALDQNRHVDAKAMAQEQTPQPSKRPLIALAGYDTGDKALYGGSEFTLTLFVKNNGKEFANNIVIIFDGGDILPLETGGVITHYEIDPNETVPLHQKFVIGNSLTWSGVGNIRTTINYTDPNGMAYSDTFNITINIAYPNYTAPTATPTPGPLSNAQLIINHYETDVDPLQPGSVFKLSLDVANLGMADAKGVSVVYGGGVAPGDGSGTPTSGGMSGGSGDLSHFAPLGSSNIVFIGDVAKQSTISTTQDFIVNVNTEPGAYTLKISFVYTDAKNNRIVDDQVITLLVFTPPQLEVSFYRDPGMLMAGMENMLPLQVVNLGKKTAVLGNMRVTSENADLFNNVSLVGSLEPGGYYSLDASIMPYMEGTQIIKVEINYTDDFNQARTYTQELSVEVMPAMVIEPTPEGGFPPDIPVEEPQELTFWGKIAKFFKALFGLGSGSDTPTNQMPPMEEPVPDKGLKGF